jgi:hypothetical protein
MPWRATAAVSQRVEFVTLAQNRHANFAELCRRFAISRQTGGEWLSRSQVRTNAELEDRSRRPYRCAPRTDAALTHEILDGPSAKLGPRRFCHQRLGYLDLRRPHGCLPPTRRLLRSSYK